MVLVMVTTGAGERGKFPRVNLVSRVLWPSWVLTTSWKKNEFFCREINSSNIWCNILSFQPSFLTLISFTWSSLCSVPRKAKSLCTDFGSCYYFAGTHSAYMMKGICRSFLSCKKNYGGPSGKISNWCPLDSLSRNYGRKTIEKPECKAKPVNNRTIVYNPLISNAKFSLLFKDIFVKSLWENLVFSQEVKNCHHWSNDLTLPWFSWFG